MQKKFLNNLLRTTQTVFSFKELLYKGFTNHGDICLQYFGDVKYLLDEFTEKAWYYATLEYHLNLAVKDCDSKNLLLAYPNEIPGCLRTCLHLFCRNTLSSKSLRRYLIAPTWCFRQR